MKIIIIFTVNETHRGKKIVFACFGARRGKMLIIHDNLAFHLLKDQVSNTKNSISKRA